VDWEARQQEDWEARQQVDWEARQHRHHKPEDPLTNLTNRTVFVQSKNTNKNTNNPSERYEKQKNE
jgi:hypothetical protein